MKIKKLSALVLAGVISCTAPAAVYADTVSDVVDAAVGILESSEMDDILSDPDKIVAIIVYAKDAIGNQEVSDEDILDVIALAEEQFQVTLSDSDKETLVKLVKEFKDMDLDEEQLRNQIQNVYDKLESLGITKDDVKGFLGKAIDFVKNILE